MIGGKREGATGLLGREVGVYLSVSQSLSLSVSCAKPNGQRDSMSGLVRDIFSLVWLAFGGARMD